MSDTAPPKKAPWHRRVPSFGRLFFFSLFMLTMAFGALVGGLQYIRNVVTVRSEAGDALVDIVSNPVFNENKPAGSVAFPDGEERMNILLLGIDYNYTDQGVMYTKGARSDTMMVISVSRSGQILNALSIPRDTYTLISEKLGYEKINAAYSFGGIKQAMETVGQFLGVPIHHYVIVKVYGAQKVFEALGGLPIDAEKDMDYEDHWAHFSVHLKKGPQVLNAQQAIGYARFRMDEEGDRGRMRRQQQVIRAVVSRLKDPAIVMRLPQLAKAVKDTLETDFSTLEMLDLARLYRKFDHNKMRSAQLVGDDKKIDGAWMIIPYGPENERTVRRLLKDQEDPILKNVRVQILNGTRQSFSGQRAADELNLNGFNVTKVADAPHNDLRMTQITEYAQNARAHERLASVFPGATFRHSAEARRDADYVVMLGNDRETPDVNLPFNPAGLPPEGSLGRSSSHETPAPTRSTAPAPAPVRIRRAPRREQLPAPRPEAAPSQDAPQEIPLVAPPSPSTPNGTGG